MVGFTAVEIIPEEVQRQRRVMAGGKRAINPDKVPIWAQELARQAFDRYNTEPVPIRWRERKPEKVTIITEDGPKPVIRWDRFSSGSAYVPRKNKDPRIVMTVGVDEIDTRLVLLHECAHIIANQGHTLDFWEVAWDLYLVYMPEHIEYCYARESRYKKKAHDMAPIIVKGMSDYMVKKLTSKRYHQEDANVSV